MPSVAALDMKLGHCLESGQVTLDSLIWMALCIFAHLDLCLGTTRCLHGCSAFIDTRVESIWTLMIEFNQYTGNYAVHLWSWVACLAVSLSSVQAC